MIPDLKVMTLEEKLLTMRNLWDDTRQNIENSTETENICILLDNRITRIELSEAELLDWDEVKGSIGRQ